MADKLSTFERRIEILFLLINSEKVTLSELSKRYSVHKNTVYNDIAFLGRYAPIRTESGVTGGIFIRENYHCDLFRYLSSDEERVLTSMELSRYVQSKNTQNLILLLTGLQSL